ncbi:unnamed protein product [Cochlearia groenlandica]
MANLTLELNIYSAKDLENVNIITKMDVYAVVSINGENSQDHKEKTAVDRTGESELIWNHAVKFSVNQRLAREGRLILVVKLVCDRIFGGKDIGEVQVPVCELLNSSPSFNGNGNGQGMRFVTYQVRTPYGKSQGSLTFSYRFSTPSFKPNPVYSNPIDVKPDFSSTTTNYNPPSEVGFHPPPPPSIVYPPSPQPQICSQPPYTHQYDSPYPENPVTSYTPSPSGSNIYPPPSHDTYPPQNPNVYPPQNSNIYPPPNPSVDPSQHPNSYPPQHPNSYPPQHPNSYPPQHPNSYPPQPSNSLHGYAPPYPNNQHGYPPPLPSPGYGYGYPPSQQPPKKNKPGPGVGMGFGLLGGALGGLLLGDIVSDIGFDL